MKKMQELQPEIKKIQEKHKSNAEALRKAQQELFQKHNYNPLSGCLPLFIQMPVFIGLWRTLSVAIELRDAPLFSASIRWCSNLAAPDMMYDWSWFMPAYVSSGMQGIFSLGPYFNLLPIIGVILSTIQQRMFMPPPADEQAAVQQKVMQYMMVFMGLLFYKFASGLCIYFIVQSLWGFVERKFLPKAVPVTAGGPETRAQAKAREKKLAEALAKKNRGKK
jgi:YidC/Oxa1 family membrane protein insertase